MAQLCTPRCRHHVSNCDVPLDPNFQGYADLQTDAEGNLRFLTVKPGPYPVGSIVRAPHIHFEVRGRDQRLITQFYFPGDDELLALMARRLRPTPA